jgi:hypothetical protein
MRPSRIPVLALILQLLTSALPAHAMNMPSYDLTSLVFFSTDIVIANLAETPDHKLVATVTETLYGAILPGDKLDTLTGFLKPFFNPMKDGMRVVLFLDRRPQKYDFLYSDLAKSPFAIPPSGVLLIDPYEHVHHYTQMDNPGPYTAEGYYSFRGNSSEPTREDDLKFPSLDKTRQDIAAAIRAVDPIRALLARIPTPADIPVLLKLADQTSPSTDNCSVRTASAIAQRVANRVLVLGDPEVILKTHALSGGNQNYLAGLSFIHAVDNSGEWDNGPQKPDFIAARMKFLVTTLADRKRPTPLRVSAAQLLLDISTYTHPYSGFAVPLPIDGPAIAPFATQIRTSAQSILADESEPPKLRALAIKFLPLDDPEVLAAIRRTYAITRSSEILYAIESAFLAVSDALYSTLKSPTGVATSIIRTAPISGCTPITPGNIIFQAEWYEPKEFPQRQTVTIGPHTPVLINLKSGDRTRIKKARELDGWWTAVNGLTNFELSPPTDLPPGTYALEIQYVQGADILSAGHATTLTIKDSPKGRTISVN